MATIPPDYHDLFREKRSFAHVGTVQPDGSPHITPVWIDYDVEENRVLVNTERGRQKDVNVRRDPSVGLSITDPDDPYRRLSVIGEVTELTTEGAREHIDELSRRYRDRDYQPEIETERILLKIRPDSVF